MPPIRVSNRPCLAISLQEGLPHASLAARRRSPVEDDEVEHAPARATEVEVEHRQHAAVADVHVVCAEIPVTGAPFEVTSERFDSDGAQCGGKSPEKRRVRGPVIEKRVDVDQRNVNEVLQVVGNPGVSTAKVLCRVVNG